MAETELEGLRLSAVEAGFEDHWITKILKDHGPELLQLILDGVRGGFSAGFLKEMVSTLGTMGMQILLAAVDHLYKVSASGKSVTECDKMLGMVGSLALRMKRRCGDDICDKLIAEIEEVKNA